MQVVSDNLSAEVSVCVKVTSRMAPRILFNLEAEIFY